MKNPSRLLILLPGTIWGISFIAVELALIDFQPITMTLTRSLISATMLYALMRYAGGRLPSTLKEWWPFFFLSLVNLSTPFALSAWAQTHVEAGLASIYLALMPLFTMILATVFTKDEKLTKWKAVGVALGFIGIIVLIGPSIFQHIQGDGIIILAQLAVIGSSILYAIGAIYIRHVFPQQPKDLTGWALHFRVTTAQFFMSIVVLAPLSFLLENPLATRPSLQSWGLMLFLGIGVTSLATLTYFYLIEKLGAGPASMTIYLIPIAGVLSGILLLGEQFRWEMGIALVLILSGIAITNLGGRESVTAASVEAT